jgi:hypothetical protein
VQILVVAVAVAIKNLHKVVPGARESLLCVIGNINKWMKKFHLDSFYTITKFKDHEQIKNGLLDLLADSPYSSPNFPSSEVNISKCDWHISNNFERSWFLFIKDQLLNQMLEIYKNVGYDGFTLQEIWFQQYLNNSGHGWHTHSSNFTNVYYLELPDDAPKTQLISPFDQKTVIEVDIAEGDIITFPSFVIHKGPVNRSLKRKSIISYNTNVTYSDQIYGKF